MHGKIKPYNIQKHLDISRRNSWNVDRCKRSRGFAAAWRGRGPLHLDHGCRRWHGRSTFGLRSDLLSNSKPSFAPFEFPTCLANGCRGTIAERSRLACLRHWRFKHVQAVAASQLPINNGAKPLVMNLLSYAKSQKRKLWVGLSAVLLNYSVPQLLHWFKLFSFAMLCRALRQWDGHKPRPALFVTVLTLQRSCPTPFRSPVSKFYFHHGMSNWNMTDKEGRLHEHSWRWTAVKRGGRLWEGNENAIRSRGLLECQRNTVCWPKQTFIVARAHVVASPYLFGNLTCLRRK